MKMKVISSGSVKANVGENEPVRMDIKTGTGGGGTKNLLVATTAEWNAQPDLIGAKNTVYVYSDKGRNEQGQAVPAYKVGDGLAYLIDLPFSDDLFIMHAADTNIHVTEQEKAFWNSKVTAFVDSDNPELLVLSSGVYIATEDGIFPLTDEQVATATDAGWI